MTKRIVLSTFGSFGDLHPFMAVALELLRRGHQPVIATSEFYRAKIEAEGLGFAPVRPDLPDPEREPERAQKTIRRVMDARTGTQFLFEQLLNPHLRASYDDLLHAVENPDSQRADLLLTHALPLSGPIVAAKTGVLWASSVLAPLSFFSAYDLPTPPVRAYLGALRFLPPALLKPLIRRGKASVRYWVRPVIRLRRALGLKSGAHPLFEGQHSPRLTLALFSRVLGDTQPDWPRASRITGFCFYDKKDSKPMPPELAQFLDEGEAPLVFTLGSSAAFDAGTFYQESARAAQLLKRRAVLLLGDARNRPALLPPGVVAFDYAPFGELFGRAACVVHQGGVGTTGQTMRAGVPSLVMPFTHDQPDHAARLKRLGIGRTIRRERYSAQRAARELQTLMQPQYARRAKQIGARVRQENGPHLACDLLEELLEGGD